MEIKNLHNAIIDVIDMISNEDYCNDHFIAFINDILATICEYIENEQYVKNKENEQ